MSLEPIGAVTLAAGLIAFAFGPEVALFVLAVAALLGAAAAVQLPALGGSSIPPAPVVLGFVLIAVFRFERLRAAAFRSLVFPKPGFWLLVAVLYAVVTAWFMPRIFAGMTNVYSMARNDVGIGIVMLPLGPRASNITQSVYLLAGLLCFTAIAALATAGKARTIAAAILVAAGLNLVFAAIDLAGHWAGQLDLLAPIRNANYRMLESGEIQGFKRIVGSFSEAGAYSYASIGFYAFAASLWLDRYGAPLLGTIAGLSLLTLVLSTSSTAYAALALFSTVLYVGSIRRLVDTRASDRHFAHVWLGPVVFAAVVAGAMLVPQVWSSVSALYDSAVTNKLSSQSGIERMQWNARALESFFDTYGFGAGLGSVRASSFVVALLANCGVVGLLLFCVFLATIVLRPRRRGAAEAAATIGRAAAMACVAKLFAATVSAGSVDLGLDFSIFAGLAAATSVLPRAPARRSGFVPLVGEPQATGGAVVQSGPGPATEPVASDAAGTPGRPAGPSRGRHSTEHAGRIPADQAAGR
ncbi:hypothetical protein PQJ75_21975 [Rhodoplanes sp. TEM]|uniref:Glycoside hydrolase n=1 Tax=Rhodoplanes tepidamans TaxID=200616 RepID=A0ABT5J708_RHOTP|nr:MULTISPECIES: hypothetical protein [Rhodoplanes]MDC7785242.1 hypothetical protein [Rhodoplanes tepidamans]MDC7986406.1 hypothetical protein [Rhodoplanes sp. TEM]MDQ0353500.1 hypothetical protein [Rhodoplanes tepidamans]